MMFDGELNTFKVQELRLAVARPETALRIVQHALDAGACLHSLSIRPSQGRLDVLLRLTGLEDAEALITASRLATEPDVQRVRLEHCWVRS
jgi:hypothetical protein